jgi:hypothetical protein
MQERWVHCVNGGWTFFLTSPYAWPHSWKKSRRTLHHDRDFHGAQIVILTVSCLEWLRIILITLKKRKEKEQLVGYFEFDFEYIFVSLSDRSPSRYYLFKTLFKLKWKQESLPNDPKRCAASSQTYGNHWLHLQQILQTF